MDTYAICYKHKYDTFLSGMYSKSAMLEVIRDSRRCKTSTHLQYHEY